MIEKRNYDIRPDAQPFDEIRIITIPRYKESEISGDEWRIFTEIQFLRKGRIVHKDVGLSNIKAAIDFLPSIWHRACDDAKGYYGGEEGFCDQEGCQKPPTVFYQKKHSFCRDGHRTELTQPHIRKFCDEHKTRGDGGLDDADSNYEIINKFPFMRYKK